MRILANDGLDSTAILKLEQLGHTIDTTHYEGDALEEQIKECDIIIVRSATKIRQPLIDIALDGNLKLIIRAGVGIDNIDHTYAKEKGIDVRNTPNSSSASVAELTLAHMLALSRFLNISNVTMRRGEWNKKQYKGIELAGKTLGLIGFGRIGKVLAKKASALGMKVIYTRRSGENPKFLEYRYVNLNTLLETADFVSCHVTYDKGLQPLLGRDEFLQMKKDAYLINTSRGHVLNEAELLEVLNEGHLAGVGLDVYTTEPTDNNDLINHPKVSVTPHIGASTHEAQKRIGEEVVAVIKELF